MQTITLNYGKLLSLMADNHGIHKARQAMKRQVFIDENGKETTFVDLQAELNRKVESLDTFVAFPDSITLWNN